MQLADSRQTPVAISFPIVDDGPGKLGDCVPLCNVCCQSRFCGRLFTRGWCAVPPVAARVSSTLLILPQRFDHDELFGSLPDDFESEPAIEPMCPVGLLHGQRDLCISGLPQRLEHLPDQSTPDPLRPVSRKNRQSQLRRPPIRMPESLGQHPAPDCTDDLPLCLGTQGPIVRFSAEPFPVDPQRRIVSHFARQGLCAVRQKDRFVEKLLQPAVFFRAECTYVTKVHWRFVIADDPFREFLSRPTPPRIPPPYPVLTRNSGFPELGETL